MDVREKSSNEKRLIDANALVEKAYWHGEHPDVGNPFAEGVEAVDMSDIDEAPTIEAEPVIRCRECKHCDPENHHCDHHMGTAAPLRRKPDDFCSYGERKEGAD